MMQSEPDRRRFETRWGPRGLETPEWSPAETPYLRHGLAVTALCLLTWGVPWCRQNFGYFDLAGNRGCAAAPSEVSVWALHNRSRRPKDLVDLRKWISRHPGRINDHYDAFCETPLHRAARFGREDLAEALVAAGADVEAQNENGEHPLHVAAAYGHPAVVKVLLAGHADVGARDRGGSTPLHAAAFGHGGWENLDARIEVAKLVLAAGADVNAREGGGFTPLRYALGSEGRNSAMADLLLSHGADPRGAK
jgi:ankyrin repeat protein